MDEHENESHKLVKTRILLYIELSRALVNTARRIWKNGFSKNIKRHAPKNQKCANFATVKSAVRNTHSIHTDAVAEPRSVHSVIKTFLLEVLPLFKFFTKLYKIMMIMNLFVKLPVKVTAKTSLQSKKRKKKLPTLIQGSALNMSPAKILHLIPTNLSIKHQSPRLKNRALVKMTSKCQASPRNQAFLKSQKYLLSLS